MTLILLYLLDFPENKRFDLNSFFYLHFKSIQIYQYKNQIKQDNDIT